jgi:acyl-CoA synthetase (AMP-forming)/AMP-acid ligase II
MNIIEASSVHTLLETSAHLRPAKIAFVQGDERVSYGQINAMANRLAAWLLGQGRGRGLRQATGPSCCWKTAWNMSLAITAF